MLAIESPYPLYASVIDGSPLDGGYLFFGMVNQNPETSPITVYWDAAGTQPAAQPIRTLNGFAARNGTPASLYVATDYSLTVRDHRGRLQYSASSSASASNSASILAVITNFIASLAAAGGSALIGFLAAGAGAILRTVFAKLSDVINAKDYGYVADAVWNTGTNTVSGTDNLAAINAAMTAAVNRGISTVKVQGFGYSSGKIVVPQGITLEGEGRAQLAQVLIGLTRGTAIFVSGATSDDCLSVQENGLASGLRHISIYNTNTNAIRSVIAVIGHLYPAFKNVEAASLRRTTGAGWYLKPSASAPNYEPLWGDFDNCYAPISSIGLSNEASVRWGLVLQGLDTTHRPNANSFRGGQFTGTWGGLKADGDIANSGGLSCVFHGVKFDVIWDGTFTPQFQAAAAKVFGATKASCYIYPVLQLNKARSFAFDGCYFEAAGAPATFNDGTNGVQNLISVVWLDTAAAASNIDGCNWNNVYLYDAGTWTNCTPTTDQHRHDTRLTANVGVIATAAQAIPTSALTTLVFGGVNFGDDSECEWDATNNVVKVRSAGTYAISGQVEMTGWTTASTYVIAQVTGGGYSRVGTRQGPQGGLSMTSQVSCVLRLNQGDTIALQVLQTQGGSQNTSGANNTYFDVVKIG